MILICVTEKTCYLCEHHKTFLTMTVSPGQGLKLYLAYDGFDGGHRFILLQVKPAHMSVFRDFGLIFSERFGPYHSSNF